MNCVDKSKLLLTLVQELYCEECKHDDDPCTGCHIFDVRLSLEAMTQ